MNPKQRYFSLDITRSLAIVFVTFNHAINRSFENYNGQYLDFSRYSFQANIFKSSVTVLSHLGVPLFLMITGFLILNKSYDHEDQVSHFYRHNWLHIVITTIIWLGLFYWFIYFFKPVSSLSGLSGKELLTGFIYNLGFMNQVTLGNIWYMMVIIPLYTILPALAVFLKKGYGKYLLLPCSIVFLYSFFFPALNHLFKLLEIQYSIRFALNSADVFSLFTLYILLGYYFSKCSFQKISLLSVTACSLLFFIICTSVQLFAYQSKQDILLGYESPLILIFSISIYILLYKLSMKMNRLSRLFSYLSNRTFGVYFIHMIIVEYINWSFPFAGWSPIRKFFVLEISSLFGGFIIVSILSKIKFVKDYLFMIKE